MNNTNPAIQVQPPALLQKKLLASPKKVAMPIMGCKVNMFESELIMQKIEAQNHIRVAPYDWADIYIINTCTVTAEADKQARQMVRKVIRKNPDAMVVVTGCYAQMNPQACLSISGVDMVVGNSQKLSIPDLIQTLNESRKPFLVMKDLDKEISLPQELVHGFGEKSRAFIQIQQGCDQGCTFCIIHKARGPNRSFSVAMIIKQIEKLVMRGYKEIVLCGVDVGSYGQDREHGNTSLVSLIRAILAMDGDFRLRLSSIDPVHINDDFINLFSEYENFCPQLHLSLQSANTLILKRMKRRAHREQIYQVVEKLRKVQPDLVLSADILVGFPTETEEHFQQTLMAIEDLKIPFPHVFIYSKRDGTPAARIPDQVDQQTKKKRSKAVREAGQKVFRQIAKRQIGKSKKLLIEKSKPDRPVTIGRTDNYFTVQVPTTNVPPGKWLEVKICGYQDRILLANPL